MSDVADRAIARRTLTAPDTWPVIEVAVYPAFEGGVRVAINRKDGPDDFWIDGPAIPASLLPAVAEFLASLN